MSTPHTGAAHRLRKRLARIMWIVRASILLLALVRCAYLWHEGLLSPWIGLGVLAGTAFILAAIELVRGQSMAIERELERERSEARLALARAEAETKLSHAAVEREKLFGGEMLHRLRNLLAIAQAHANDILRSSPTAEDGRKKFVGRIAALGASVKLLYNVNPDKREDFQADVRELLSGVLADVMDHVTLYGPNVALAEKEATDFAAVVYEMRSNATKYGSLLDNIGHVRLSWTVNGDRAMLVWAESGGPELSPVEPTKRGYGSTLIDKLTELGSFRRTLAPEGARIEYDFFIKT